MTTTQKILISVFTLLVLGLGVWVYFILFSPSVDTTEREKIWTLSQELLDLTEKKQACLDELPYFETMEVYAGKSSFCSERDEKIATLKAQHEQILNKPYKQVVGLLVSR